ncbi:MAG: L-histidine N(alpha)-methyltransferase [Mucilaginibacter sp.]
MLTVNPQTEETEIKKTPIKDSAFREDVVKGLQADPKYLPSKYFYDKKGDEIFKTIMGCAEYYPFQCELEIFSRQTKSLANAILQPGEDINLIELGAGDCTKSAHLLSELVQRNPSLTYMPIDISESMIEYLECRLPSAIPGLKVKGLNGDYLDMLGYATADSNRKKVVLFLGANIGNMNPEAAVLFCNAMRRHLRPGDMVIIGFDLKKKPSTILTAYNDKNGITREFNLNLLHRINRELNANFDVRQFEHYPVYDPGTGGCKSYLISNTSQQVTIPGEGGSTQISFKENEPIFMEISQKYSIKEIEELCCKTLFEPVTSLFDEKRWFMDAIWRAV